jgi:hypothetical protein
MSLFTTRPFLRISLASSALLAAALPGCQHNRHMVTKAAPGQVTVCAKCYDQLVKARGTGGPRGGLATGKFVARHACEECKTEMSIYTEADVSMIRCGKCAPDGMACDKCVPPADYVK